MLLPPDLREWVADDDLVHFLVDALPLLDLSPAVVNVRGTGSEQYPPGMMLGLLVYCYANGVFSSRRIERATYQHVSVRYLAANTHPDHDTIAKFRRENGPLLREAFKQVLQLAQRAGLLQLGTLALDGTKLEASATKRQTLTLEQLEAELRRLDGRVSELLQAAEKADAQTEAAEALPVALIDAQRRRTRLLAAKEQLAEQTRQRQEQREKERAAAPPGNRPRPLPAQPRSGDTVNPTDPDSTLTPSARQAYIQGYNAQLVVTAERRGLIVAADVVRDTNDLHQLEPMVTQAVGNVGSIPTHVLVDTGYDNLRQIIAVEAALGCQVLCPPAAIANAQPATRGRSRWRQLSKLRREEMRQRLQSPAGRGRYRWRSLTVEPVIGILKSALGFRRFSVRGLEQVRNEWQLVTLAFNCRRLAAQWV